MESSKIMNRFRPLSTEFIDEWFDRYGHVKTVDANGRYILDFPYEDETKCAIHFSILCNQNNDCCLSVRGFSDRRFQASLRISLLEIMNEYSSTMRWPLLRLRQEKSVLCVDTGLDVNFLNGVSSELFDEFMTKVIGGTYGFWHYLTANEEKLEM